MENQTDTENTARASATALPVSTKHCIEICSHIRGRDVTKAKLILEDIMLKKRALPLTRFNKNRGHKKGVGPGSYPQKATAAMLKLLESAEANAQFKGLNTKSLIIKRISAQRGSRPYHYGRKRGLKAKRTHVDIILEEAKK